MKGREKLFVRFPLTLTMDERATLERRAKAVGMTMHEYAVAMVFAGKVNKKPK